MGITQNAGWAARQIPHSTMAHFPFPTSFFVATLDLSPAPQCLPSWIYPGFLSTLILSWIFIQTSPSDILVMEFWIPSGPPHGCQSLWPTFRGHHSICAITRASTQMPARSNRLQNWLSLLDQECCSGELEYSHPAWREQLLLLGSGWFKWSNAKQTMRIQAQGCQCTRNYTTQLSVENLPNLKTRVIEIKKPLCQLHKMHLRRSYLQASSLQPLILSKWECKV